MKNNNASIPQIYFVLLFTALAFILTILLSLTHFVIGSNDLNVDIYNWVKEVCHPGKQAQMVFFMASIPAIFLFIIGYKIFVLDWVANKLSTRNIKTLALFDFFFIALIAIFASYRLYYKISNLTDFKRMLFYFLVQVLIGLILPVFFVFTRSQKTSFISRAFDVFNSFYVLVIALFAMLVFQCFVYYPLATNKMPYVNEYLNIPSDVSHKVLGTTNSIEAINSIRELAIHIRPMTDSSDITTNIRSILQVSDLNKKIAEDFAQTRKQSYYYDFFMNTLVATRLILEEDIPELQKATGASTQEILKFVDQTKKREKIKGVKLEDTERSRVEELRFNLHWQILSRWYFHHHNFVWGPVLKFANGIDLKSVFFQYGISGGALQYGLSKYLMGGFQIPNYFLLWSVLFGVYFVIFHLGIYSITKSNPLTVIASVLFMAFLLSQQYEYIFLGPGLNPIRHFLDIPAFVFAFRFFTSRSKTSFFGFLVFILLNFILNPEFGLFCSAALLFSVFIYLWVNKIFDKYFWVSTVIVLMAHAFLWGFLKTGQEVAVGLYLGGFFSPVLPYKILFSSLLLMAGLVTALVVRPTPLKDMNPEGFLLLAALLYISEIFLYPLFGMSWNHIVNISPIIVFTLILGIHYISKSYPKITPLLLASAMAFSTYFFMNSYKDFFVSKATYEGELSKYKSARWSIKGNPLLTQIPEKPILDSVNIIEKYSKTNKIAMISRFDNLLPLLTQKALSLPANEMMAFLLSDNEYQKVLVAFAKDRPEILFTDRDILLPSTDELIDPNTEVIGYLYQESKMRLDRVNRLKVLFSEVKAQYQKIDEGGLLTVWKRI